MKKLSRLVRSTGGVFALCALFPTCAWSKETPTNSEKNSDARIKTLLAEKNWPTLSEGFGHFFGGEIKMFDLDLDLALVVKGIKDCFDGKESPLSTDECIQALTLAQEAKFEKLSEENLAKANEFMHDNEANKDVITVEPGKVQYLQLEKGAEGESVESDFSPLVHYVGKLLDGTVFGESEQEEILELSETIPGLQKGIVGMKSGEKRRIFIHPEMAYGNSGYLPPNATLIFDVEVTAPNASRQNEESPSVEVDLTTLPNEEIADINVQQQGIR